MTNSPDERGAELRELFFETSQELLQALNEEALKLEKNPGDEEIVRVIRRTVHTLKGDSAACGLRELSELAHQFEDALSLEGTRNHAAVADIAFADAGYLRGNDCGLSQESKLPVNQGAQQKNRRAYRSAEKGQGWQHEEAGRQDCKGKSREGQDRCFKGCFCKDGFCETCGHEGFQQGGFAMDRVRKAGHGEGAGGRPGRASRHREDRSALRDADRGTAAGENAIGTMVPLIAMRPDAKSPAATKQVEFSAGERADA